MELNFHLFSLDDVEDDIILSFEFNEYSVSEGFPSIEVCVVTSRVPDPGQVVSAQLSTQDATATGTLKIISRIATRY